MADEILRALCWGLIGIPLNGAALLIYLGLIRNDQ